MTSFCTAGDTARVTFPDNSIRDFPSPININVIESYPVCPSFNVTVSFREVRVNGTVSTGTRIGRRLPVRAFVTANGSASYIADAICSAGSQVGERLALITAAAPNTIQSLTITSITRTPGIPIVPYTITVSNFDGSSVLFSGNFSSPNYTVVCIAGCPPNTLDCGDCCLDCDTVNIGLTSIRDLIINL